MSSDGAPDAPCLPPKLRYQAQKRRLEAGPDEETQQHAGAPTSAPSSATASGGQPDHQQLCPSLPPENPFGNDALFGEYPLYRDAKQTKITTSLIQGTAQPRKPRIGAEFQAIVPEWKPPAPKAPFGSSPKAPQQKQQQPPQAGAP